METYLLISDKVLGGPSLWSCLASVPSYINMPYVPDFIIPGCDQLHLSRTQDSGRSTLTLIITIGIPLSFKL